MKEKVKKARITATDFEVMDAGFPKTLELARALDRKQPIPHSVSIRAITLANLLTSLFFLRQAAASNCNHVQ